MGEKEVSSSEASNLKNVVTDFSVDSQATDGISESGETTWTNQKWGDYLGYYKAIPEVMSVIDAKASWTVGNGFTADPITEMILDSIKGFGVGENFTSIIENMDRTREIGGDAYAEIITDEDDVLINLKTLDPASIKHVVNDSGILIRFEQISKVKGKDPKVIPIEKMFYIPRNRIADEIHGNSMIERLAAIILARNEAMADIRQVYHRFVKPRWIIKLDTDKPAKIAAEKVKWDKANEDGENMYIPMGSVEVEQMAIAPNSTLNPQTWIDNLNTYFYESAQVPRIIVGGSGGFTDAAVKIAYLGFENNIKKRQKFWEDQILSQLNLEIKLIMNSSLMNDLLTGTQKDGNNEAIEPNDVTAEVEGRT